MLISTFSLTKWMDDLFSFSKIALFLSFSISFWRWPNLCPAWLRSLLQPRRLPRTTASYLCTHLLLFHLSNMPGTCLIFCFLFFVCFGFFAAVRTVEVVRRSLVFTLTLVLFMVFNVIVSALIVSYWGRKRWEKMAKFPLYWRKLL